MKEESKQIIKLTTFAVLKTMVFGIAILYQPFAKYKYQRREAFELMDECSVDFDALIRKIRYLKRHGLIREFYEGKKRFIEIS